MLAQGVIAVDNNTVVTEGDIKLRVPNINNVGSFIAAETAITASSTTTFSEPTDFQMDGVVICREAGIKLSKKNAITSGVDASTPLVGQFAEHVANNYNSTYKAINDAAFDLTAGVLKDTHVINWAGGAGDGLMSADQIINAKYHLGEVATKMNFIMMHSKVKADLLKQVSFDNVKASDFDATIIGDTVDSLYGMRIIENDTVCAPTDGVYPTYIGSGQPWFLANQRSLTIEQDYKMETAGGTFRYLYRYYQMPHLLGISYTAATANPTNTQLALPASYSKVWQNSDIRLVQLLTLIA
jgi:hypothetical protein